MLFVDLKNKVEIIENETSKYWYKVLSDLKERGVKDIFIACIDGLNGFDSAINSVFPNTIIQRCIVHIIRNSVKFVSYKDLKKVCTDLKTIYKAKIQKKRLYIIWNYLKKNGILNILMLLRYGQIIGML